MTGDPSELGDPCETGEPRSTSSDRSANGSTPAREPPGASDRNPPLTYRRALDGLVYAIGVTVVLVVGSALVSFAVGGGWGGVKYLLFFVGFALFGLTALSLRPAAAWKDDRSRTATTRGETRFQATIRALPPLRRHDLAPDERLPAAAKLFVTSLFVLGVSFAMETVFGVAG